MPHHPLTEPTIQQRKTYLRKPRLISLGVNHPVSASQAFFALLGFEGAVTTTGWEERGGGWATDDSVVYTALNYRPYTVHSHLILLSDGMGKGLRDVWWWSFWRGIFKMCRMYSYLPSTLLLSRLAYIP